MKGFLVSLYYEIIEILKWFAKEGRELFRNAYLRNQWGWFHGLAGGIFAYWLPVRVIFVIALFWEIIELLWHRYRHGGVEKVYGTKKRFLEDAFGDITLALVFAEIVKLYPIVRGLI